MTTLAVMSDIHLEFDRALIAQARLGGDAELSPPALRWWRHLMERDRVVGHPRLGPDLDAVRGADLLILAGDIDYGVDAVRYAAEAAAYCGCPAVLVPGNHEFYDAEMTRTLAAMRAASSGRVDLLDGDRMDFDLGGGRVAVLGATLWTDYRLHGGDEARVAMAMRNAEGGLNDHRVIRHGKGRFLPKDALALHWQARDWLADSLPRARAEADRVVVVTHHAPTPAANPPRYADSRLSPAFASDLEAEIAAWQPDLWISGHTHFDHDRRIGRCRLVSRQRGYIGVEGAAPDFAPLMVTL
jgi:hypothetical protein